MINPNVELFKWGPIDGRPAYTEPFLQSFAPYPKHSGVPLPDFYFFFKEDKCIFISEYAPLRNQGKILFKRDILDDKRLPKLYEDWLQVAHQYKKFEKIENKGLVNLSDEKLITLYKEWHNTHLRFWLTGLLPEFSNWGGEQILKEQILKINKLNFIEIFETLSAPENFSFFQIEELELMKIKLLDEKNQKTELRKHQKRYYWLRNSYAFTEVLDVSFFEAELKKITKEQAEIKIMGLQDYSEQVKNKKRKIVKKYSISKEVARIGEKLAYCVWWQDYRKQYIFIQNHIISSFLKEVEKRKNIPFKELCYYRSTEIIDLLEHDKRIDAKLRISGFNYAYIMNKDLNYSFGKVAEKIVEPFLEGKVEKNVKEIKGIVVSKGDKVKAAAKIILSPRNMDKLEKGDILVAPMTSPDYIVAMRKASAIITDEGGMTSHAAIVSRELKKPCIVGTKVATKWIKDDDLIEIDTDKGIVTKLK